MPFAIALALFALYAARAGFATLSAICLLISIGTFIGILRRDNRRCRITRVG